MPFEFKEATSEKLLHESFRLRYHVYCDECHFIDPSDHPDGFETDEYDESSRHFVITNPERVIGSARLILDSPKGFLIEKHCPSVSIHPRHKAAELSRFIILESYRRRGNDWFHYPGNPHPKINLKTLFHTLKRKRPPLGLGLLREMYCFSKVHGITKWYALMERVTWHLLRAHGFVFKQMGKAVDVYGPVTPYMAFIEDIEKALTHRRPHYLQYFTERLPEYEQAVTT